jgi:hypothetical protein
LINGSSVDSGTLPDEFVVQRVHVVNDEVAAPG